MHNRYKDSIFLVAYDKSSRVRIVGCKTLFEVLLFFFISLTQGIYKIPLCKIHNFLSITTDRARNKIMSFQMIAGKVYYSSFANETENAPLGLTSRKVLLCKNFEVEQSQPSATLDLCTKTGSTPSRSYMLFGQIFMETLGSFCSSQRAVSSLLMTVCGI